MSGRIQCCIRKWDICYGRLWQGEMFSNWNAQPLVGFHSINILIVGEIVTDRSFQVREASNKPRISIHRKKICPHTYKFIEWGQWGRQAKTTVFIQREWMNLIPLLKTIPISNVGIGWVVRSEVCCSIWFAVMHSYLSFLILLPSPRL